MLLGLNNISKHFGTETLFENISFEVAETDKIGLIGINGAGKTTLFKILTGEMTHDGGDIFKNRNLKIGYIRQHFAAKENTGIFDEVLKTFDYLTDIERELEDINLDIEIKNGDINTLTRRQHELSEKFADMGGFVYKSHIKSTLTGLGFSEDDFSKKLNVLSGGELTRVQLAKLLLSDCNLLLLDEPTNHLDITSTIWLEDFLSNYKGSVIVISHDRYFLDKVTNKTIEISGKRLFSYKGGYTEFMRKKQEFAMSENRRNENTRKEIERIYGIVEQQRSFNREKNIKTAESKLKMIERLENTLTEDIKEEKEIRFKFKTEISSGNDVLFADNLSAAFNGRTLFTDINMHITKGERIFLIAPNGAGKTTLFKKIISGGDGIRLGANVKIGYYDQTQQNLDNSKTILDEIRDAYPLFKETELRNACAAFLFRGDDVFKSIESLSGGERARVSLLKLMLSGSNFLMLDEPTNHLDIASKEALEQSFADYSGTMLVISHDRYFINKLADKIYHLTPDGIKIYEGNYDYYLEKINNVTQKNTSKCGVKNDYRLQKERDAALRRLNNALKKCENKIAELEQRQSELEITMNDTSVSSDYGKLSELTAQLDEVTSALDSEMENWENIQTELDGYNNE